MKFFLLNEERVASILHISALSKFLSVKRDVNVSTRKSMDVHFSLLVKGMTNLEEKGK